MNYLQKYHEGEVLRLAARAVWRQARKRGPIRTPPKSIRPEDLPKFEAWYELVLAHYDGVEVDQLTKAELAADQRWIDAVCNACDALAQKDRERKEKFLEAAGIDPYGHLTWGIGDGDDFVCLDWGVVDGLFVFQSVVNSETGSFVMEFAYEAEIPSDEAVQLAIGMVDGAYDWCFDNEVQIDHKGWNYSAWRFVEDVKREVEDTKTVNPFVPPVSERKKQGRLL